MTQIDNLRLSEKALKSPEFLEKTSLDEYNMTWELLALRFGDGQIGEKTESFLLRLREAIEFSLLGVEPRETLLVDMMQEAYECEEKPSPTLALAAYLVWVDSRFFTQKLRLPKSLLDS